jgi:hypothetical protein
VSYGIKCKLTRIKNNELVLRALMEECRIELNYTNATEWFCKIHEGEEDGRMYHHDNSDEEDDYSRNENECNERNKTIIDGSEEERDEVFDMYPQTLPFRVGKIINKMAPVSTFCATVPNNNHNLVLNNLNRTKSLDNLNFEEKRQIIASSLSLADILSQGAYRTCFPFYTIVSFICSMFYTIVNCYVQIPFLKRYFFRAFSNFQLFASGFSCYALQLSSLA